MQISKNFHGRDLQQIFWNNACLYHAKQTDEFLMIHDTDQTKFQNVKIL